MSKIIFDIYNKMLNYATNSESHFEAVFKCKDELLKKAILELIEKIKADADSWYFDTLTSSFFTIQKTGSSVTFTCNLSSSCGVITKHTVSWNNEVKSFILDLLEVSLV